MSIYTLKEFKVVTLRECPIEQALADTPQRVYDIWKAHVESAPWFMEDKETMVVFLLNSRRRLTGFTLVSIGLLDTLLCHPRDAFRMAIVQSAAAIILAHNHPSGDPSPSEADIKTTRDMMRAGQLLKIELLDHVIVGKPDASRVNPWVSLREQGYLNV